MSADQDEVRENVSDETARQKIHWDERAEIFRLALGFTRCRNEQEVYQCLSEVQEKFSAPAFLFVLEERVLALRSVHHVSVKVPERIEISVEQAADPILGQPLLCNEANLGRLPAGVGELLRSAGMNAGVIFPVRMAQSLVALLLVGLPLQTLSIPDRLQPLTEVTELAGTRLDELKRGQTVSRRIAELETLASISQEIASTQDLSTLFATLHERIRLSLGDPNFYIALYDQPSNSISIPYMFEKGQQDGEITHVDTFPLGEGLTSIIIRSKQPLMLVEETEKQALALGAKVAGKPAKSWMGTPMVVSDQVIGAIVVQDTEHERAFDGSDLEYINTLSRQVAGALFNIRLLEETRGRALQLETAAEIARDISGSLDVGELLAKATTLIRERFSYYHSSVFLVEPGGEYAVIREATGDAGVQMKRAGHKLKVGSKSIVGYVTSSGELLIVNDTSRDATYFANPLLPETRAEVAIPLKVGSRILGALDVQSTRPFSFGEEVISVLRILADQLAVAVINSELFAETQEHLSQHRLLHHVTTAAASGSTLEESLSSATQGLQVTLGGDRVSIMLADKERKVLVIKAIAGYSEEVFQMEVPFGEGITGWVASHQQPLRINDVSQDPRYIKIGTNVQSELAVPLAYRGEILGVLNVESDQLGAYSENDEELLGTLGGSLAAIIANARLIEQVRQQVDRERILYEITSKIRRSTDVQTIMATTATELSKALGAKRTQITIEASGTGSEKDQSG